MSSYPIKTKKRRLCKETSHSSGYLVVLPKVSIKMLASLMCETDDDETDTFFLINDDDKVSLRRDIDMNHNYLSNER